jgi:hypothetical protein
MKWGEGDFRRDEAKAPTPGHRYLQTAFVIDVSKQFPKNKSFDTSKDATHLLSCMDGIRAIFEDASKVDIQIDISLLFREQRNPKHSSRLSTFWYIYPERMLQFLDRQGIEQHNSCVVNFGIY